MPIKYEYRKEIHDEKKIDTPTEQGVLAGRQRSLIYISEVPGVSTSITTGAKGKSPYDYCQKKGLKKSKECLSLGGRYCQKIMKCTFINSVI